ncbi:hypothetical protein SprV_0100201500 [Sparganum proliferum]
MGKVEQMSLKDAIYDLDFYGRKGNAYRKQAKNFAGKTFETFDPTQGNTARIRKHCRGGLCSALPQIFLDIRFHGVYPAAAGVLPQQSQESRYAAL